MAVKMKDIIKCAVIAAAAIGITIMLVIIFIPRGEKAVYNAGEYSAQIILHNEPVEVIVTVSENEILDISLSELGQTQEVFYPLFEPVMEKTAEMIIENQSVEIDFDTDEAITSQILANAVDAALKKAEKH